MLLESVTASSTINFTLSFSFQLKLVRVLLSPQCQTQSGLKGFWLCFFSSVAMGGGNGQKAKMAREKHMEKQKAVKGSQLESNKNAMNIQCKVCMQTFVCTTSEVKCREHAEAKHPKAALYTCFPHLKK